MKSEKKKPDRFRGRKGRASKATDSKVLPGAPGSEEFARAARTADEKAKAAKKAAKEKATKDRRTTFAPPVTPPDGMSLQTRANAWLARQDGGTNVPAGGRPASITNSSSSTNAVAAAVARDLAGLAPYGLKPKSKSKTPAEKRRKQPGAGR